MRPAASFLRNTLGLARRQVSRRTMSSSTESTQKKAQDALAAAQKNAGRFLDGAKKFLEPAGEKVGVLLGSYRQPLLYNLSVTKEVFKQIYLKENLQPPSLETIKSAYSSLFKQITSAGLVGNLLRSGELGRVGVYGLQAYGIFKIGEIVGRRHLVGYKLD